MLEEIKMMQTDTLRTEKSSLEVETIEALKTAHTALYGLLRSYSMVLDCAGDGVTDASLEGAVARGYEAMDRLNVELGVQHLLDDPQIP